MPVPTPPRVRGNTSGPARDLAVAIADRLNAIPDHGWVCEESHPTPVPATHVWACAGHNDRIYNFGLCTLHSAPGDPDAVSVRIAP